jgi:hypothetical protein
MSGLYFLAAIIGILLIIHWYITNEGKPDAGQRGLFAMRDESETATEKAEKSRDKAMKRGKPWVPPSHDPEGPR